MTVHSLRHKFATAMVEDGVDLNRIRAVLGHSSLATTQRYIDHLTSLQLRAAVPSRLVPCDAHPAGDESCPAPRFRRADHQIYFASCGGIPIASAAPTGRRADRTFCTWPGPDILRKPLQ